MLDKKLCAKAFCNINKEKNKEMDSLSYFISKKNYRSNDDYYNARCLLSLKEGNIKFAIQNYVKIKKGNNKSKSINNILKVIHEILRLTYGKKLSNRGDEFFLSSIMYLMNTFESVMFNKIKKNMQEDSKYIYSKIVSLMKEMYINHLLSYLSLKKGQSLELFCKKIECASNILKEIDKLYIQTKHDDNKKNGNDYTEKKLCRLKKLIEFNLLSIKNNLVYNFLEYGYIKITSIDINILSKFYKEKNCLISDKASMCFKKIMKFVKNKQKLYKKNKSTNIRKFNSAGGRIEGRKTVRFSIIPKKEYIRRSSKSTFSNILKNNIKF